MYFNDKGIERSRDQEIEGMKENIYHSATGHQEIEGSGESEIKRIFPSLDPLTT